MTPQELEDSILWEAIQGKLTIQNDSESAWDIIESVKLSPVHEEEVYFEIPDNWLWVKICDIFDLVNGKAFKPTDWSDHGIPIVRIQNLNDPKATFNYFSGEIEEKYILHGGELLFSWSGTPGTSFGAFIWHGETAVLNQHIFIVYPRIPIDYEYAKLALNGELRIFISKAHGGAGLKHITRKEFDSCYLPIPPLAEQKRIVAMINDLMPKVEEYGKAEEQLSILNSEFPDKLRKSILQQAIQGKLTERDPADEPAAELLKRIRTEKEKLIKEGKIKKEKPLPPITEDEIPFEIPDTWSYTRLSELAIGQITYGIIKLGEEDESGVKVLRCSDVKPGWINPTGIRTVKKQLSDEYSRTILQGGEIVINVRGTLGGCAIVPNEYAGYNVAREVAVLPLTTQIDTTFILYVLLSPTFDLYLSNNLRGVAYKGLNIELLSSFSLPIPPLGEQKRIVERVNELLTMTEELKGCYE